MSAQSLVVQRPDNPGVTVDGVPVKNAGNGGAYEGADRLGRELMTWQPKITTADGALGRNDKVLLDNRGRDIVRNSGQMQGAMYVHKDSIVGTHYRLNSAPNALVLGWDEMLVDEFQREVEAKFMLWAEADENWCDAAQKNNFTSLIRLAIGCDFVGGEVLATSEWIRGGGRPFATCIQMIDADRLSNPQDRMDDRYLRRGIEHNRYGVPLAAHIRMAHPRDNNAYGDQFKWKRVPFRKGWGRLQVLHILEQIRPDQTRGVADMVAVLKETRMAKSFHEVSLQNAIVNASYAAAIESELPPEMAFTSIGANSAGEGSYTTEAMSLLQAIAEYSRGGKNLEIDGVKIPHLFPGSKLKLMPAGTVGGVGQSFEDSLNRYISTGLNISYEEYTHDYSKTNYSSSKAAANATRRAMQARKRKVADRMANAIYTLWLEEAISEGQIESVKHLTARNPGYFYEGMNKQAICRASWIGASVGQVDEMKETQAAVLRIKSGLSTYEIESARLGYDFRDIFEQAAREQKRMTALGINFNTEPTKGGTLSAERVPGDGGDAGKEAAYQAGTIDIDGMDANGSKPFDDGFGDD